MGEGESRALRIASELLFDTATHPITGEKVYVEPSACSRCSHGRLRPDGIYECYCNECPWGYDEEEDENND